MVITLRPGVSSDTVDAIRERLERNGTRTHLARYGAHVVVGWLGDSTRDDRASWQQHPDVASVKEWSRPWRLASSDAVTNVVPGTRIRIGDDPDALIGGDAIAVIAGPCSVERLDLLRCVANGVRESGAIALRGGAFKPRTSPYAFQGLGPDGLELLSTVRRESGLPVVTEVVDPRQVELVAAHADVLQIGARNMQNYALLAEVARVSRPVLLKRGFAATIPEFLLAVEHILANGGRDVILCERGIRTFETSARFTLDISAIPILKRETHLPVIVDPSHAAGDAGLVPSLAYASIAAGADGLLVEVHSQPELSRSDSAQALSLPMFADLMSCARGFAAAAGRRLAAPGNRQVSHSMEAAS